ncbi:MAG: HyaD/HybD family hydrogenase maturation endopeptidase [Mitsuokella multacida]|nr:HyaD/HybD family hydrogenase maturation endopeptidase [Mitsuokella multacida]
MSMADVFGNDSAVDPRVDDVLHPADVTILGVGNVILRDEGFGVRAAEYLDAHYDFPESVQVVDGGTLGIELTQYVTGTKKLLVIDSINGGQEPGTRFHFHNDDIMTHFQDKLSAHEVGIQDVLALLTVTGRKIPEVVVLGAQPYDLEAGVELSPEMKALLPLVAQEAIDVLKEWGIEVKEKAEERSLDYGVVAEECVREEMK